LLCELTQFRSRLLPARPDLAAAGLEGEVQAARFARGEERRVVAPLLDLTLSPDPGAGLATQLLHGEPFTVFETRSDGLSWGQSGWDGYVGYVASAALGAAARGQPRRITARCSHVYSEPHLKARTLAALPASGQVAVVEEGPGYALLEGGGHVPVQHLAPCSGDPVDRARRFLGSPYLWGGRSAAGLDCSALVQLAFMVAGIMVPRDSDMQEAALGEPLPPDATPARGDLWFWRGHVGMLAAPDMLLHANAFHMAVVEEPLAAAVARIAASGGGAVTARRRPAPG
jgi:cell wall-associated NlpC family hydrolase